MELESLLEEYQADGCIFPVKGLCSAERLDEIDALLSKLVGDRPQEFFFVIITRWRKAMSKTWPRRIC